MSISTPYEYNDWITYASGTSARLTQLRLHIQEVSALISSGNFSGAGVSNSYDYLEKYLQTLMDTEKEETKLVKNASKGSSFVKGLAR